jgi:hypothetical protein
MAAKRQKPGGGKRNHNPTAKAPAPPPLPAGRAQGVDPTTCNRLYDDEEAELLRAVDEYKRKTRRAFPTYSEILAVVRSLGWRKVEPAGPLPGKSG